MKMSSVSSGNAKTSFSHAGLSRRTLLPLAKGHLRHFLMVSGQGLDAFDLQ